MKSIIGLMLFIFPLFSFSQTPDSNAIRQVDSLIQVSRDLTAMGEYTQALEVNSIAGKMALSERNGLGEESVAYASYCFNQGRILFFMGNFPEAEKWYLEAKRIREKTLGKNHPDYAKCLLNLGALYWNLGEYPKAEPLYQEAKAIQESAVGKNHPDYAQSVHNLALLYREMEEYDKAESFYLEAIEIYRKTLGNEHPEYALGLNNLGNLYLDMGRFPKAEPLLLEARSVREKALGREHPDYANSLNNLGYLYQEMGDYEKAEPFLIEAKIILEKTLGKEHPDYAWALNNLALLNFKMGQYDKTELFYLEALPVWKKTLGGEHPYYAKCLNNLALLYYNMGQFDKAESLFIGAESIWEKTLGKEHSDYALSLSNLATLSWTLGQLEKAERLYQEAKSIVEKTLGKNHPEYAHSLNNLANVYADMGHFEKAEMLYLESSEIREKALGRDHFEYISSQLNLASLYQDMGQFKRSESYFLLAREGFEKVLGKEHPYYAETLNKLALLYQFMGNYEKAESYFLEFCLTSQRLLEKAIHHLSERELNKYVNQFSRSQDQALSFAGLTGRKKAIQICFDNSLFYKGFLLYTANRKKRLASSNPLASEKFKLLKSCGRRLAVQYSKPILERDRVMVADLEEKVNILEKELAQMVNGYGKINRQVNWQEVLTNLHPGEAALEFVRFSGDSGVHPDSNRYAALIMRFGDAEPRFVPLFKEREMEAVLFGNGDRNQNSELAARIYTRGAGLAGTQSTSGLYRLLWQSLDTLLADIHTVYYSPTGLLHRINLDAVPFRENAGSKTLSDKYRLVRLNSTRALVMQERAYQYPTTEAFLFGGIRYEADSAGKEEVVFTNTHLKTDSGEPTFASLSRNNLDFGATWNYLPGTESEISKISELLQHAKFPVKIFSGDLATEGAFKQIGEGATSPRILHLATHGFFFPEPKEPGSLKFFSQNNEPIFRTSDNPMLRSGLILAGGNHAWQTGKPLRPDMEDGILTAYEISQMNLSSTELVVLSACETGLGDIQGNEGVYGLQRAFKIAGAKYLIMSLWQVPDQETSIFMTTFYKNFLESRMTIPDAFRATQQQMRERFNNPYLWAGFVLVE